MSPFKVRWMLLCAVSLLQKGSHARLGETWSRVKTSQTTGLKGWTSLSRLKSLKQFMKMEWGSQPEFTHEIPLNSFLSMSLLNLIHLGLHHSKSLSFNISLLFLPTNTNWITSPSFSKFFSFPKDYLHPFSPIKSNITTLFHRQLSPYFHYFHSNHRSSTPDHQHNHVWRTYQPQGSGHQSDSSRARDRHCRASEPDWGYQGLFSLSPPPPFIPSTERSSSHILHQMTRTLC